DDILEIAREYRSLAHLRSDAHDGSSEWHRARGAKYGVWATILSAVVSSTFFVALTQSVNVGSSHAIPIPTGVWGWVTTIAVGVLLVVSPALTGVTAYLKDPDQAQRHKVSAARYYSIKQQLDLFILRYAEASSASNRDKALQELEAIAHNIAAVDSESIT